MKPGLILPLALLLAVPPLVAQPARQAGYTPQQADAILEKTQTIRLAADLSRLAPAERQAVAKLIEAGRIFQDLYEDQRHRDAARLRGMLFRAGIRQVQRSDGAQTRTLYRLFSGPIATNLENRREPFMAVQDAPPGRNVYPWDLTRAELDAFFAAHPEARAELANPLSVVRRADAASLAADLAVLRAHPVLDTLHPGLRQRLQALAARLFHRGGPALPLCERHRPDPAERPPAP